MPAPPAPTHWVSRNGAPPAPPAHVAAPLLGMPQDQGRLNRRRADEVARSLRFRLFNGDPLDVAIVGCLDIEEVRALVAAKLGCRPESIKLLSQTDCLRNVPLQDLDPSNEITVVQQNLRQEDLQLDSRPRRSIAGPAAPAPDANALLKQDAQSSAAAAVELKRQQGEEPKIWVDFTKMGEALTSFRDQIMPRKVKQYMEQKRQSKLEKQVAEVEAEIRRSRDMRDRQSDRGFQICQATALAQDAQHSQKAAAERQSQH